MMIRKVEVPRLDAVAIGWRIRDLRCARGWCQRRAAEKVGMNGSVWNLIEHGRRLPNIEHAIKLAALFRRSVDFVLFGLPRRGMLYRLAG
jgi:DNA-binding XRE family transcriptional regulator